MRQRKTEANFVMTVKCGIMSSEFVIKNPDRVMLVLHQREEVFFTIMTDSLDIIPLIVWLFTKKSIIRCKILI